jgi:hypothetical protein
VISWKKKNFRKLLKTSVFRDTLKEALINSYLTTESTEKTRKNLFIPREFRVFCGIFSLISVALILYLISASYACGGAFITGTFIVTTVPAPSLLSIVSP